MVEQSLLQFPSEKVLKSDKSTGSCTCVDVRYNPDQSVWLFDTLERRVQGLGRLVTGVCTLLPPDEYDSFIEDVRSGRIIDAPSQTTLQARSVLGTSMNYIELIVRDGEVYPFTIADDQVSISAVGSILLPHAKRTQLSMPVDMGIKDADPPKAALLYDAVEWLAFMQSVHEGGFQRPPVGTVHQLHPAMTQAYPLSEAA